jgi:transcriptional regulator with XRE-family HTH domain
VSDLGSRLRQLRQARDLTLREVAAKIDLHFTTLSKAENGHERLGEATLRELAYIYDTDLDELLALAGKVPPELLQRAGEDWDFAMLLRALPWLPQHTLEEVYRVAGVV